MKHRAANLDPWVVGKNYTGLVWSAKGFSLMASLRKSGWKTSKNDICHHQCPSFTPPTEKKNCPRKNKKINTFLDLHDIDCAAAHTYSGYYQNYQLQSKTAFFPFSWRPWNAVLLSALGAFTIHTPTHGGWGHYLHPLQGKTPAQWAAWRGEVRFSVTYKQQTWDIGQAAN